MNTILSSLKIKVNAKIYIKDPETSALGKRILKNSIFLIDEIGFENFTFKKLGERIGSNESSIYRYFENKHKLLVYLSSCYWSWIEFKLVLATTNITNPKEKLNNAIRVITEKIVDNQNTDLINEAIMNKIIIAEFSKTLQTKEIDEENKEGYFLIYKSVINRIVNIINEVNPKYPFAKSLTSSIVEGSLHQHFLTEHLKTITDCNEVVTATQFYIDLAENVLSQNQ
jgi:hypothetical protein